MTETFSEAAWNKAIVKALKLNIVRYGMRGSIYAKVEGLEYFTMHGDDTLFVSIDDVEACQREIDELAPIPKEMN